MQGAALSAGRAAWYIACLFLSLGAAVAAGLLGPCLDWSMLEIGVLCLMPALLVLDVGAMCVHGWAWIRLGRLLPGAGDPGRPLSQLAWLAGLHLATAGFGVLLLACPTGGVWMTGAPLLRLRVAFLACAVLGFLLALETPGMVARLFTDLCQEAGRQGPSGGSSDAAGRGGR
ncbi:MAG: hypothetical protein IK061_07060 [Desulfovibrio sp.]|nr:hypothetical protein [Desulfovibrio sp.]